MLAEVRHKVTLMDLFAFAFSIFFVGFVIYLSKILEHKGIVSKDAMREIVHITMGVWGVLWFLFDTQAMATLLTAIVTTFLILAPRNVRSLFSGGEERHIGLILYSIMFTVITALFWKTRIGSLSIFTLAFGDGFAGLIGKRYGKHKIKVFWSKVRSVEGSISFFVATIFSWLLAWLIYGGSLYLIPMLIFALAMSIVEALSPPHTDNVLIPLFAIVFYYLLIAA